jgi:hypothetical protein
MPTLKAAEGQANLGSKLYKVSSAHLGDVAVAVVRVARALVDEPPR